MARKPAHRGASRGAPRRPVERQVPGWVWLFTGITSGLFIAFLYHLATVQTRQGTPVPPVDTPASTTTESHDSGPRFDFYAVLPKMEVIVPKSEPPSARRDTPAANDTADIEVPTPLSRHERYLLQAGSFRNNADADRRRGELILQGHDARIQPVSLDSGDTWYRVMVGPFDNANAAHRIQDKLAAAGIETLAIRARND